MTLPDIEIVEVAPRDGLQNEKALVSTADKAELVNRALAAGLRRLEVTSFVNPKRVPQMADAEALMATLSRPQGAGFIGLALNQRGFERARDAGCNEVNFVVVASETFNQRNQGVPIADTLASWASIREQASAAGLRTSVTIGASFGCPFEGEMPANKVLRIAEAVLEHAPDELAFADTIGCGVPTQVKALLRGARALAPDLRLRCHFHDTRATGIANVAAAVENGVQAIDASIGGIGGCPFAPAATGNVATEDVVYMLERMGLHTGVDLDAVIEAARWIAGPLGKPVPSALSRAGGFPPPA
ncbi:MAG: hydroxymethylglutaryl-CoA lyase [Rhodobacteraceae bacterium HLUCCA12]|nr:MAG: hydroxymethylglutaryl-CoA lyase [Rhodobacteraceae bacterium HLUCCA12]